MSGSIEGAEGLDGEASSDKSILDGVAGLLCGDVGYGRDELADVAYRQMTELP